MVQKSHEAKKSAPRETVEDEDASLRAAQEAGKAALENVNQEDLDAILDDIEGLLEENAETFVEGFVQKGGQ